MSLRQGLALCRGQTPRRGLAPRAKASLSRRGQTPATEGWPRAEASPC
ncbi:MAG: hypothetical protein LBK61_13170 [Spirochaetaceae bacterium]|nr:hypothetical protein [Spirochaetaceae bacterium]